MRIETGVVWQHAGDAPRRKRIRREVLAADARAAAVRREHGRENPKARGLARAVRAEQSGDPAVRRRKGHALERLHGAEPLADTLYLDHAAILLTAPGRAA
jgi:hypothetical protein